METVKDYIPPQFEVDSFHCPWCDAYAHQKWYSVACSSAESVTALVYGEMVRGYRCAQCAHCKLFSFWYQSNMIFPASSIAPQPSTDMPPDVVDDFNEAREVLAKSPRSSAALLRLSIQKLCKHLGQPGKNINDDIGALVKAGLPLRIQKALDYCTCYWK